MAEPLSLRILKEASHKPVSIDYLTFRLGASRQEIERYIGLLQNEGAVRREAGNVKVVSDQTPTERAVT